MNDADHRSTTFVTLMTADAPGAIAVLRLWGDNPLGAADHLFQPKRGHRGLTQSRPGELRLGWFGADEVVATVVETGEDRRAEVEIQGHGSRALVQLILQQLEEIDVKVADKNLYQQHHGTGWLERLALEHLGRATAPKAAEVLYSQSAGALRDELLQVKGELELGELAAAANRLGNLMTTARWGTRLSQGLQVALAGAPNVGKSTLVNALAGYERVLVSPVAGTTRDLVDVALTIHGWPVVVTDTAGLRDETGDPLEAAGMALARSRQSRSDLVIRLFEAGGVMDESPQNDDQLNVLTKMDLCPGDVAQSGGLLAISAQTGQGLDVLMREIVGRLIPVRESGADSSIGVVFDARILELLEEVMTLLRNQNRDDAMGRIVAILES